MKKSITVFCFTLLFFSHTVSAKDWRVTAKQDEKINNLIEVMPGASVIMLQMGERFRNLYWAGKQGKWDFAEYQVEEMQDLIQALMITRPKRAATAKNFQQSAFTLFPAAFEEKKWSKFSHAFENMRSKCMVCHIENKHAFIVLPAKPRLGSSPVLDTTNIK